jgi:membrane protein implicated in regulation of membrane protease activity
VITLVAVGLAVLFLPSPWNWLFVVVAAIVDVAETSAFLWWSRRRRPAVGVETLVGRRATVVTPLLPTGQVRVDGELWQARSAGGEEPGDTVVIRAVEGLELEVEPAGMEAETSPEKH